MITGKIITQHPAGNAPVREKPIKCIKNKNPPGLYGALRGGFSFS
jgi:hypothetical protein